MRGMKIVVVGLSLFLSGVVFGYVVVHLFLNTESQSD
jgi:hypothetical protein